MFRFMWLFLLILSLYLNLSSAPVLADRHHAPATAAVHHGKTAAAPAPKNKPSNRSKPAAVKAPKSPAHPLLVRAAAVKHKIRAALLTTLKPKPTKLVKKQVEDDDDADTPPAMPKRVKRPSPDDDDNKVAVIRKAPSTKTQETGEDPEQTQIRPPHLESSTVLVMDARGNRVFSKGTDQVRPIASVTKLMTAMVVLDADLPMDEMITISREDSDTLRYSSSRLRLGQATLNRRDMLQIALMSSENRAAAALGRTTFPGGTPEFVRAMNRKAQALGMTNSHFMDPTGLNVGNVSTAPDLVKMVRAAGQYALIREATTTTEAEVSPYANGSLHYVNTNRLVRNPSDGWEILLSKTGYINEAGHCLVMEVKMENDTFHFILLNAPGKLTHFGDSARLCKWLLAGGGF